jgi:hypothetical protein
MTVLSYTSAVEAARGAIVDVLDGRGLPELGGGQTAGEPAVVAESDFAIDEETEPIGMWHIGRLRIVLQLDEGVGHGGEAEGAQPSDGGMNEHDDLQSIVVVAAANVGVEENGRVRSRGGSVLAVAQDGGDRLVGACIEE